MKIEITMRNPEGIETKLTFEKEWSITEGMQLTERLVWLMSEIQGVVKEFKRRAKESELHKGTKNV